MRIEGWEVENYKSIQQGEIDLSDLTVLIGKNNAGKSNLIDSLRDYQYAIENNRIQNFGRKVYGKDTDRNIRFRIKFRLDDDEFDGSINSLRRGGGPSLSESEAERWGENGYFRVFEHSVEFQNENNDVQTLRGNYEGEMVEILRERDGDHETLRLGNLPDQRNYVRNRSGLNILNNQAVGITSSWSFVNPKREASPGQSPGYSEELAPDAHNLEQVFDTIYRNDPDKYRRISEKYVEIMEGVEEIRTELLPNNRVTSYVIEDVFPEGFTLNEISSGSMEILLLITKVVLAEENLNLLLVEEPELHLHPGAQRALFDLMDEVTENRPQIVVSTHSAEFIDKSDIENIVMVSRTGETELRSAESGDLDEHLTTLGYDKSDILQSSGVVFVEGRSDKSVFEVLSKEMGNSLIESGIELVPRGEPGETEREIIDVLDRLSIPYLFVLDGHGENPSERQEELRTELGVGPDRVKVLTKYGIESYLKDVPGAVADAFNLDPDYVKEYLDENTTEDNEKGALKDLYEEEGGVQIRLKDEAGQFSRDLCQKTPASAVVWTRSTWILWNERRHRRYS